MLMVRDVEASSRWYQQLLGLTSDHGGPDYERLLADGELVLQLHHEGTDHHHGPIGDAGQARGNGVLVWFGAVSDFDGVVERAGQLGADVVKAPHRNPPEGEGNGPGHREIWVKDPDGYVVAVAGPDGEAWEARVQGYWGSTSNNENVEGSRRERREQLRWERRMRRQLRALDRAATAVPGLRRRPSPDAPPDRSCPAC